MIVPEDAPPRRGDLLEEGERLLRLPRVLEIARQVVQRPDRVGIVASQDAAAALERLAIIGPRLLGLLQPFVDDAEIAHGLERLRGVVAEDAAIRRKDRDERGLRLLPATKEIPRPRAHPPGLQRIGMVGAEQLLSLLRRLG